MLFPTTGPPHAPERGLPTHDPQTHLTVDDLILPLFAIGGKKSKNPDRLMPGIFNFQSTTLVKTAREPTPSASQR